MIFLLIKMFQFTSNCGVVIFIPLKVDYQSWEIVHNFTAAAKFFALRIIFSYLCSVSLVPYCVVFMKNFHTWELRKKKSRWTCGSAAKNFHFSHQIAKLVSQTYFHLCVTLPLYINLSFHGHCVSLLASLKKSWSYQFKVAMPQN